MCVWTFVWIYLSILSSSPKQNHYGICGQGVFSKGVNYISINYFANSNTSAIPPDNETCAGEDGFEFAWNNKIAINVCIDQGNGTWYKYVHNYLYPCTLKHILFVYICIF